MSTACGRACLPLTAFAASSPQSFRYEIMVCILRVLRPMTWTWEKSQTWTRHAKKIGWHTTQHTAFLCLLKSPGLLPRDPAMAMRQTSTKHCLNPAVWLFPGRVQSAVHAPPQSHSFARTQPSPSTWGGRNRLLRGELQTDISRMYPPGPNIGDKNCGLNRGV